MCENVTCQVVSATDSMLILRKNDFEKKTEAVIPGKVCCMIVGFTNTVLLNNAGYC